MLVRPKGVGQSLLIRGNSSDLNAFGQIFIEREYECLNQIGDVELVIDAGANVGYSSVYFLSHFPRCRVVAIEPDPRNFEALQQNLAPYADRVDLRNAGVWSHPAELRLQSTPYRDGREWSRQVRECGPDEKGTIDAIDIRSIVEGSGCDRVSILKIDIEGSECIIFSPGMYESWLDRVDTIAIELHDDSCFGKASEIFDAAIRDQGFSVSRSGELTICQRRP